MLVAGDVEVVQFHNLLEVVFGEQQVFTLLSLLEFLEVIDAYGLTDLVVQWFEFQPFTLAAQRVFQSVFHPPLLSALLAADSPRVIKGLRTAFRVGFHVIEFLQVRLVLAVEEAVSAVQMRVAQVQLLLGIPAVLLNRVFETVFAVLDFVELLVFQLAVLDFVVDWIQLVDLFLELPTQVLLDQADVVPNVRQTFVEESSVFDVRLQFVLTDLQLHFVLLLTLLEVPDFELDLADKVQRVHGRVVAFEVVQDVAVFHRLRILTHALVAVGSQDQIVSLQFLVLLGNSAACDRVDHIRKLFNRLEAVIFSATVELNFAQVLLRLQVVFI